jgi:hypothetical protein
LMPQDVQNTSYDYRPLKISQLIIAMTRGSVRRCDKGVRI